MATMSGQEDAISTFTAAKQWKQALNVCEKKLKKSPESDFLLVTKINILLQWTDASRFQQGLKELESLLERKPPVADIEALHVLDKAFVNAGLLRYLTPKQTQTWQRAAASRPQDEKLHITWYRTRFQGGDFKGAQQVSISSSQTKTRALSSVVSRQL